MSDRLSWTGRFLVKICMWYFVLSFVCSLPVPLVELRIRTQVNVFADTNNNEHWSRTPDKIYLICSEITILASRLLLCASNVVRGVAVHPVNSLHGNVRSPTIPYFWSFTEVLPVS